MDETLQFSYKPTFWYENIKELEQSFVFEVPQVNFQVVGQIADWLGTWQQIFLVGSKYFEWN